MGSTGNTARTGRHPSRPLDGGCLLAYTALFCATALAVLAPFIAGRKSLIWGLDGINQHFPSLIYLGQWLREVARTLFAEHSLDIPLWDPAIGYGADIAGTLHYYALGDPLALLSALVPPRYTEVLYDALIVARMYLAGLFFSLFCRSRGHGRAAVLAGSVAYVFCGWTLFAAVRHPFFMNPLVYLPLLALGVDRVFAGKSPVLLIGMVAVSAASNFYFFYMLTIAVAAYALARYLTLPSDERSLGRLARWIARFLGYGACGALMAAAVMLPAVMLFISGGRSGISVLHDAFYSGGYYAHLLSGLVESASSDSWAVLGFSAPTVIALIVLYAGPAHDRRRRVLKAGLAVLFALLLVPEAGSALNGFSYVTNRWCWALAAACSYALVEVWPELSRPTRRQRIAVVAASVAFIAAAFALRNVTGDRNLFSLALLGIGAIVVAASSPIRRRLGARGFALLAICLTAVGCVGMAHDLYAPRAKDYVDGFVDAGTAYARVAESPFSQVPSDGRLSSPLAEDGGADGGAQPVDFGRTEVTFGTPRERAWYFNASALTGVPSTQSYYSLSNGSVADLLKDMGITDWLQFRYQNVGGRAALQALMSVRYAILPAGRPVPEGFTQVSSYSWQGGDYVILRNDDALPFGFTYDAALSPARYAELDATDRQQALLDGVLLEGDGAASAQDELAPADTTGTARTVPCSVETGDGVEQTGTGSFTVSKAGARLTLRFQGSADAETYLVAKGTRVEPRSDIDPQESTWTANRFRITVSTGSRETGDAVARSFTYATPYSAYTLGQRDFVVNLGYAEEARTELTITFPEPGDYRFDELGVACQPLGPIREAVAARGAEHLENVRFQTNRVSGDISVEGTRALFLSLPYDRGWTAYVDGRKVELYRANRMGMALMLDSGEHHVELRYETYGLRWGLAATGLGFAIFFVIALRWRNKKRRRGRIGA